MRRNTHRALALAAGLLAGAMTARSVSAEEIWVKSQTAEIREGKGAVFPLIATADKGAKLEVISREPKGWIKVKLTDKDGNSKEGYVYENSISTDKVSGGGNILAAMGAGAEASSMTSGAAGRGFEEGTVKYASTKNLSSKPLQDLINFRKSIDPKDWQNFTATGKVGPDAP